MNSLIEVEPGKFTDRITNTELIAVLGLDDREELDEQGDTIMVCAGTWKRLDEVFWAFVPDADFDA